MRRILQGLIVLAVPVVLTMLVVRVLTSGWYPALEYARPGFPEDPFGLPQQERLRLAQASIRFLNIFAPTDILEQLTLSDGTPAYNARELGHMDDVKRVFSGLTLFAGLCLLGAIGSTATLLRLRERRVVWQSIATGGGLTLALLVVLGVWMALGFDAFFTSFHDVFFAPGTWVFSYSDTLIRLFPLPFWQDAGFIIAGTVSLISVLLVIVGTRLQRRM